MFPGLAYGQGAVEVDANGGQVRLQACWARESSRLRGC